MKNTILLIFVLVIGTFMIPSLAKAEAKSYSRPVDVEVIVDGPKNNGCSGMYSSKRNKAKFHKKRGHFSSTRYSSRVRGNGIFGIRKFLRDTF